MNDKKAKEFVIWTDMLMYTDKTEKGFEAIYNMLRKVCPNDKSLSKSRFIQEKMIEDQYELAHLYNTWQNASWSKKVESFNGVDIRYAEFLFELERKYFLVRIKRIADEYLNGGIMEFNEENHRELDRMDLEGTTYD